MTRVATPHGEARVTEHGVDGHPFAGQQQHPAKTGTAVLLHGAGTSTDTPLLVGLANALADAGIRAVRLDQPYVLGPRRPPAPATQLDEVVRTVLADITGPIVLIGRSSGARVACRVAATADSRRPVDSRQLDIRGIVALGFPLQPPGRPTVSRALELAAAGVPVCVVQGSRDAFGTAARVGDLGRADVTVHEVIGADHGFAVRRRDGRTQQEVLAQVVGVVVPVVLGWLT